MQKRERHPWGSSRIHYSVRGLVKERDENFLVTLQRHSRDIQPRDVVVAPAEYTRLLDLVESHTIRRFKPSRAAYDNSLRHLELFICRHQVHGI